jgi:hypothetical protein
MAAARSALVDRDLASARRAHAGPRDLDRQPAVLVDRADLVVVGGRARPLPAPIYPGAAKFN